MGQPKHKKHTCLLAKQCFEISFPRINSVKYRATWASALRGREFLSWGQLMMDMFSRLNSQRHMRGQLLNLKISESTETVIFSERQQSGSGRRMSDICSHLRSIIGSAGFSGKEISLSQRTHALYFYKNIDKTCFFLISFPSLKKEKCAQCNFFSSLNHKMFEQKEALELSAIRMFSFNVSCNGLYPLPVLRSKFYGGE